jgi:ADP-ribosylglycohydrolase
MKTATPISLPYARYYDKVLAAWLGKSVGGVIGAPLENHKELKTLTVEQLWPPEMGANDDLDIQVVWLEALQEAGLYPNSATLARFWQDRCWYNFCEYGIFLHNLQRGIAPPLSGTWNNRFFSESEGCPIRSDIWGLVCPGNPVLAAQLARLDGQLDHGGVSVEIEQFLAACMAHAVVHGDFEGMLAAGIAVLPADSPVVTAIPVVRRICREHPTLPQAWRILIRTFGDRDASKAITNHAIVLMSLFLGRLDFRETMRLCANSGWDTDCTAATAGALLGGLLGTAGLPADWVDKLGPNLICGIAVKHKNASLAEFAEDTCRVGVEMALARNPAVSIQDAPAVTVRPPPVPAISLETAYPNDPVLWNDRETRVSVTIRNPLPAAFVGELGIQAPPGLLCTPAVLPVSVPAGGAATCELRIRRQAAGGWVADRNLFTASLAGGGDPVAIHTFGLGGARQWLVYGPYWDMWDKDRYPECLYNNPRRRCNPCCVGCARDFFNHYVSLDRPYLDETRLLREELPEEVPLHLERGEELITHAHLGGFKGQACYYFVRTLRSSEPRTVALFMGRSGPFRAWLDGQEVGASHEMREWSCHEDEGLTLRLTGRPQRLVIKLVRLSDILGLHVLLTDTSDPRRQRGISYVHDDLADQVPTAGVPAAGERECMKVLSNNVGATLLKKGAPQTPS